MNVDLSIDPRTFSTVLGTSEEKKGGRTMDGTGIFDATLPLLSAVCAGLCHCLRGTNSVIVHILDTPFSKPIKTSTKRVG